MFKRYKLSPKKTIGKASLYRQIVLSRITDDVVIMKSQVIRVGTSVVARCDSLCERWEISRASVPWISTPMMKDGIRNDAVGACVPARVARLRPTARDSTTSVYVRDYNALARWERRADSPDLERRRNCHQVLPPDERKPAISRFPR